MTKLWRIRPHDPERIAFLEREAKVPAVVAQLLACRGLHDAEQIREFLNPKLSGLRDPDELPGAAAAADRLMSAIRDRRPIVVYGDYDADGITGAALLYECLTLLGAQASYYVPHRIDEGYGLHEEALRMLAGRGASLVVTVDCGIASIAQADIARELGLELIITDHHEWGERLPAAAAIVHPRLPGSAYPFGGLSGAGVAFKVAWAVCKRASDAKKVSPPMREFLLKAVGLAAIGTVADVVPLVDENRILVHHGLASLGGRPGLGMQRLLQLTKLAGKPALACEDIGFMLAPRLNAAGRLGQAQLAVELLTTNSAERASALADYLHELNNSRDSLERSIYLAAHKQAQEQFDLERDAALVLAGRDWHPGVVGIVAGRLAEKYHRPVVVVALDGLGVKPGVGSVRGVAGFHVHQALAACSDYLLSHGGHAAAGGLKIEEVQIEAFREEFCRFAAEMIPAGERIAELWIDGETTFSALTLQAVEQLESLGPFGEGNRRPLLCAAGVSISESPRAIGGGGRHLSLRLAQHGSRMRGVAFGQGERIDELANLAAPIAVVFRPIVNHFQGRRTVELHIVDWRTVDGTPDSPPAAGSAYATGSAGAPC
ncbi:MAG TPA: single-stranded-DNA-specific exonuclease RecJ [Pirellulales bacterium]|jgi:single-stranded-DNA-specific exonuclease|nr:single-stranded-DNA-specific exonuclease RecJ [Pirellulales bacterium]